MSDKKDNEHLKIETIGRPVGSMRKATAQDRKEKHQCEICGMWEDEGFAHFLVGEPVMCDFCYDERYDD